MKTLRHALSLVFALAAPLHAQWVPLGSFEAVGPDFVQHSAVTPLGHTVRFRLASDCVPCGTSSQCYAQTFAAVEVDESTLGGVDYVAVRFAYDFGVASAHWTDVRVDGLAPCFSPQTWICGAVWGYQGAYPAVGMTEFLFGCPPANVVCAGDGSDAPCPCGNTSARAGVGCRNGTGRGAALTVSGQARVGADTLVLHSSAMPTTTCVFLQGDAHLMPAVPFGDGLNCLGGLRIRLGSVGAPAGQADFPEMPQSLSIRGGIPAQGGTRWYQVWYRDSISWCTPAAFNLTNAVEVAWTP